MARRGLAQAANMVAASAMLMVIEALTPCTTAGVPRLGGGAVLVRPVTSFEPVPFLHLGPTSSVTARAQGIQQTGAAPPDEQPETAATSRQCEAPISVA